MEYTGLNPSDLLEPYEPNWNVLKTAPSEAPFLEAGFYLLRELTQLVAVIASLRPQSPLDRNGAIVRGLLMRLTKLLRLTIRELVAEECFQQLSVMRGTLETLATLKYLIDDDGQGSRFDQYIMNSLIVERELIKEIAGNVKARSGSVWNIEERMQHSVKATADAAGITDVTKLPGRAKIGFPSAEARVKLLGPSAYIAYRTGSSEAHGDWNDLFRNHLTYDGVNFQPNPEGSRVRPHTSLTPVNLVATVVVDNAERLIEADTRDLLVARLSELNERGWRVTGLHEALLARKSEETAGETGPSSTT